MNKTEGIIVALLVVLLIGLGYFQRPPQPPAGSAPAAATGENALSSPATDPVLTNATLPALTAATAEAPAALPVTAEITNSLPEEFALLQSLPEETGLLTNSLLVATVSSRGGGIRAVTLNKFQEEHHVEQVLTLDFSNSPALSLAAGGWLADADSVVPDSSNGSVVVTLRHPSGLVLTRELRIRGDYLIGVKDLVSNPTDRPLTLTGHSFETGPMHSMGAGTGPGVIYMGIDSLSAHGGEGVRHWGRDLATVLFDLRSVGGSCKAPDATGAPAEGTHFVKDEAEWISAKNKFFVQMLLSKTGTDGILLRASREMAERSLVIETVGAGFRYPILLLNAGETHTYEADYYVGPKSLSLLKELGRSADKTMEFGKRIGWISEWLLNTLNAIHAVIPNYGVAIILLTVIVRLLLWPITAKSTKSMKRMQEMQPRMQELRNKFKDKPQKLNQEMMALYKAEKINPMAGCLPMLFQLPVFFALYTMLQCAVELRFASFLWVHDLSAAENLFGSAALFHFFPFSMMHGLNILPLLMTGATIWQMKLTPSAGDPQQQMVMKLMPIMMMVMMYNMASGLMLYWTTSTLISILQTKITNTGSVAKPAGSAKR